MADFEEHREDINPKLDENDEYDDNYLDELHEKDDWVLVLGFEGNFCSYIIIQIFFTR